MGTFFLSDNISNNFCNKDQVVTGLNNFRLNSMSLTNSISISGHFIGLPLCKVIFVNLFVSRFKYFFFVFHPISNSRGWYIKK